MAFIPLESFGIAALTVEHTIGPAVMGRSDAATHLQIRPAAFVITQST